MSQKLEPNGRDAYRHFQPITTRWMDNDAYGHVNNVVYYAYFDTVVNKYLIEQGVLDYRNGSTIGLVVETHCNYFSPIAFPDQVQAGLRVARIGTTSVRYEVGLFRNDKAISFTCMSSARAGDRSLWAQRCAWPSNPCAARGWTDCSKTPRRPELD